MLRNAICIKQKTNLLKSSIKYKKYIIIYITLIPYPAPLDMCYYCILPVPWGYLADLFYSFRGWDFQVVRRISDDWTIPSEASWERIELKQLGAVSPTYLFCICMLLERIWMHFQHISGFLLGHFIAKKLLKIFFSHKQIIGRVELRFCYRLYVFLKAACKQGILTH